jgi:DNA-binding beta-propeller fold protein YncE
VFKPPTFTGILAAAHNIDHVVRRRVVPPLALAGVLVAASAALTGAQSLTTVVEGLVGPRGVAVGPGGRVVFAENDGSLSVLAIRGADAWTISPLGFVPENYIAPAIATLGGQTFALTAGGPPGSGAGTLYRATPGKVRALADIAAYQQTDPDPYNLTGDPVESNPFGVAALPDGSVLVSDAAANDLLRV